jgi:proton-dependent oligopeptide transporter, POT family
MWERMSYYGMRALLVLYMVAGTTADNPGFGFDSVYALRVYGTYTSLVYFTPLLGGFLADRYLGQRRAVMIGGSFMMLGHFLMAVPDPAAFYAALGFLIVGNGFFKPNISTMVGGLYPDPSDGRRDGAFTIFYMGINLGAVLSPFLCGTLGERVSFHWGFGAAGLGMGLSLLIFVVGAKRLLPAHVGAAPGARLPASTDGEEAPFKAADVPVPVARDRMYVMLVLALFSLFFWAAFEQAGGLFNLYTDQKVDRRIGQFEVATTWFQSINPFFIIVFAPVFSVLWSRLAARNLRISAPLKMALGLMLVSLGFVAMIFAAREAGVDGKASMHWVVLAYLGNTLGELCISPIGLSAVSKLAPKRQASLWMGAWFAFTAMANWLAGWIGSYAGHLGEQSLFSAIMGVTLVMGLVLAMLSRPLSRRMHGVD